MSPTAYAAFSAVAMSSATSGSSPSPVGPGSAPSTTSMIGSPVIALVSTGLKASPGGPLPPTTLPSEPITKTDISVVLG